MAPNEPQTIPKVPVPVNLQKGQQMLASAVKGINGITQQMLALAVKGISRFFSSAL